MVLEEVYKRSPYLTSENFNDLSILLKLNRKSIQIWFQNKRSDGRVMQSSKVTNYDSEYFENKKSDYSLKLNSSDIVEICISIYEDLNSIN